MPTWTTKIGQFFMKTETGDMVPLDGIKTVTTNVCNETDTGYTWDAGEPFHYNFVSETVYAPQSFTATIKLQLTRAQKIAILYHLTSKRDVRRLIRRAERKRRDYLRKGRKTNKLQQYAEAYAEMVYQRY